MSSSNSCGRLCCMFAACTSLKELRQSELLLAGGTVALTADPGQAGDSAGYELALPASSNSAGKVLGSRDFIRFYKQRHRPNDTRESVQANAVVARYAVLYKCQQHSAGCVSWPADKPASLLAFLCILVSHVIISSSGHAGTGHLVLPQCSPSSLTRSRHAPKSSKRNLHACASRMSSRRTSSETCPGMSPSEICMSVKPAPLYFTNQPYKPSS